jgi:hypothetical protein
MDDDIRLIYIGSAQRALGYAAGHLPEPTPRPDQILAVEAPGQLDGLTLPPWCHIATELHVTRDGAHFANDHHTMVFAEALSRRRRIDKRGTSS